MISKEEWTEAMKEINEELQAQVTEDNIKEALSIKAAAEIHLRDEIKEYASYLIEAQRESLGLAWNDTSRDREIVDKLKSGEKLSKSKHMESE